MKLPGIPYSGQPGFLGQAKSYHIAMNSPSLLLALATKEVIKKTVPIVSDLFSCSSCIEGCENNQYSLPQT